MTELPESVKRAVHKLVQDHAASILDSIEHGLGGAAHRSMIQSQTSTDSVDGVIEHLQSSVFTAPVLDKIRGAVSGTMTKHGLRRPPDAWVADSFTDKVPTQIADAIKDGSMDLFDVCQSDLGRKKVDDSFTEQGAPLHSLQISQTKFAPFSVRSLNSKLCSNRSGTLATASMGDNAKYVHIKDLFDFSNQFTHTREMSIPTALVTLNNSSKKPHIGERFFYPDNAHNRVGGVTNLQTSGAAYQGAVNLANAWNKLVYDTHGKPEPDTQAYAQAKSQMYTNDEITASLGAMALLMKHQPEKTEKYMQLCYGQITDTATVKSVDTQLLLQHLNTITSEEDKQHRLELFQNRQQWKDEVKSDPVVKAAQGIPRVMLCRPEEIDLRDPTDRDTGKSIGRPITDGSAKPAEHRDPKLRPAQNNTATTKWTRNPKAWRGSSYPKKSPP